MKRNRLESDNGFTLVELIVVIALVGLMTTALAASITVFVRNEGAVSERLTDTRDLQNLTNFLPADVASAQLVRSDLTGNPDDATSDDPTSENFARPCGTGGDILLHLEWNELWVSPYDNRVTYRVLPPAGSNDERLVRFECTNSDLATQFKIAEAYDTVEVSLQRISVSGKTPLSGTVEIIFTYLSDGSTKRVTATSRHFLPS